MKKAEIENLINICQRLRGKYDGMKSIKTADDIMAIIIYAEQKLSEECVNCRHIKN